MSFAHFNRFLSIFARVAIVPVVVVLLHENAVANHTCPNSTTVCSDTEYCHSYTIVNDITHQTTTQMGCFTCPIAGTGANVAGTWCALAANTASYSEGTVATCYRFNYDITEDACKTLLENDNVSVEVGGQVVSDRGSLFCRKVFVPQGSVSVQTIQICTCAGTNFPFADKTQGRCRFSEGLESSPCFWQNLFEDGDLISVFGDAALEAANSHLEFVNNQITCTSNTRACNVFPVDGTVSYMGENFTQGDIYSGYNATWDVTNDKWNVDNCLIDKDNLDLYDNTDETKWCKGKVVIKNPTTTGNAATGFKLKFTPSNTNAYYRCTSCWMGNTPYYQEPGTAGIDGEICNIASNERLVCYCAPTEKGFFSTGCNVANLHNSEIPETCKTACPVGQTTAEAGATAESQCIVDTDIQYSDATGWFTLGDGSACLPENP